MQSRPRGINIRRGLSTRSPPQGPLAPHPFTGTFHIHFTALPLAKYKAHVRRSVKHFLSEFNWHGNTLEVVITHMGRDGLLTRPWPQLSCDMKGSVSFRISMVSTVKN